MLTTQTIQATTQAIQAITQATHTTLATLATQATQTTQATTQGFELHALFYASFASRFINRYYGENFVGINHSISEWLFSSFNMQQYCIKFPIFFHFFLLLFGK